VWGFFRTLQEEDWPVFLFYILLALLFNPLSQINFERGTWKAIDITFGALILISSLLLDAAPFDMLLKKPFWENIKTLTVIIFGVAWIGFGSIAIYYSVKMITKTAKVKINGMETQARITRVTHDYYYTEDANDMPLVLDIYITEYTFQTEDGRPF